MIRHPNPTTHGRIPAHAASRRTPETEATDALFDRLVADLRDTVAALAEAAPSDATSATAT